MTLIGLIITLVIVGFVLYLINNYIPMDATVKNIINVIIVIFLILWLLNAVGGLPFLNQPVLVR
jgi:Mn2+/Fe2+ NRAMP family transporter